MDEQALLQEIIARPDDDTPRLAYADAIAARDPDRAAFIRAQIGDRRKRRHGEPGGEDFQTAVRLRDRAKAWVPALPVPVAAARHIAGFVECVTVPARTLIDHGEALARAIPLRHVDLTDGHGLMAEVGRCPTMARLVSLGAIGLGLDDDDARAIAAWDPPRMRWLDLSRNRIGPAGLDALAASPGLRRLDFLDLLGNPCGDPADQPAWEGNRITDVAWTNLGAELEARHGEIPWLHWARRAAETGWTPLREDYP